MPDGYTREHSSSWPFTDAARRMLSEEAALAWRDAAVHCNDCRWYHASWPSWRALDLASGADLHRQFFRASLPKMSPQPRVLLSGAGDSALLAVAADAFADNADAVGFHVLDRCATPLVACQRFAAGHSLKVQCHHCDILRFEHSPGFDLILVHAFLGFIEPRQRPALFRRWRELLAPAGQLLLVQRLRPRTAQNPTRFSRAQTERFVGDVQRAAAALPAALSVIELEAAAREYARCKLTHPVADEATLRSLCADAGLRIVHCGGTAARRPGSAVEGAAPTLRNDDGYLHLVAMRESGL